MTVPLQRYGVLRALHAIDPTIQKETYDLSALIDSTLRLPENIENIKRQLGISDPQDHERYYAMGRLE